MTALDLIQGWRNEVLHLQSARYLKHYIMHVQRWITKQTRLYHRIAGYVEIIHLESAERLQLLQSEDIKSEEFLADSIIFSEVKVHLQA